MILRFCEAEIRWCVPRRQRTTARKWGWKAAKAGHGRLCWRLPSELPPDASPWHPQPLAVPAGLSLCGRHVWSWLAGVLAWRSHLSIIDPSFLSLSFLCLPHTTSLLYCSHFLSLFYSFHTCFLPSLSLQPLILLCYYLLVISDTCSFSPFVSDPQIYCVSCFQPPCVFNTLAIFFFSLHTSYMSTSPVC